MTTIYNWYVFPWAWSTPGDMVTIGWEPTGPHVGHTLVRTLVWASCRKWINHEPPGFPEPQTDPVAFAYFQSKQIRDWNLLPGNPYDSTVDWAFWSMFSFTPGFGYVTDLFLQGAYDANIDGETHAQRKATADLPLGCVTYNIASGAGDGGVRRYPITGSGAVKQLWRHELPGVERNRYAATANMRIDVRLDGQLVQHQQYSVGATMAPPLPAGEVEDPEAVGDPVARVFR